MSAPRPVQAVILAGGIGSRLGSLTGNCPKPLLPVAGRPFIHLLFDELVANGIDQVIVSAGYRGEQIRDYFAQSAPSRLASSELQVVIEERPLGTGGALDLLASRLQPEFLLLNGDSWFDFDLADYVSRPFSPDALVKLALCEVDDAARYGAVQLEGGRVTAFREKGASEKGAINAGVYHVKRGLLSYLGVPPCSLEQQVLPRLAAEGRVDGHLYRGYFIDIGVPESYAAAQEEIVARLSVGG